MKKLFKSISVLVLSISLALSGFVFTGNVKAEITTAEWEASAIKTPTEGSLVGAGYIDVEFDSSLSGYEYEVFLDDNPIYWKDGNILRPEIGEDQSQGQTQKFTSGTTQKTEVYTTGVARHKITVKATKDGEPTLESNREFFVSRKGLAMGDNMGSKVSLKKLNCSWYYNWGTDAFNNSVDNGVVHIPMMWGGADENKEAMETFSSNSNYILGFNEPDIPGQANMNNLEAYNVWKDYITPLKMRKVSPAPAAPGGNSDWLKTFVNGDTMCINPKGVWDYYEKWKKNPSVEPIVIPPTEDVDAVCLHYYQINADADDVISSVQRLWNTFHKPVWITEIGLFGKKSNATDKSYDNESKRAEIQSFLVQVVTELEKLPYVERYCWFPYDVESANAIDEFDGSGGTSMFEYATGLYTELGRVYSGLANPEGYNTNTISNSEYFNWDNRVKTEINYDSNKDKLQVSWSQGALENLSKVNITIDDKPYSVSNGGYIDTSALKDGKHAVEFTLYENNTEILKRTRGFVIGRSVVPTTVAPTKAPTKVNPTVKPIVKPGKATLKGKNIKKKSAKLSWAAVSGAKKYRLQWALNKKFTKSKKTKTITKLTYKVTKLKKKKTYFFRVAAINSAGIGPWSNVKKIKIKK